MPRCVNLISVWIHGVAVTWMCYCGSIQGPSTAHRSTWQYKHKFMGRLGLWCLWLVCLEFIQSQRLCRCSWAPLCEGRHCSNPCGSAKHLQNELQEQGKKTVQEWRWPLQSCSGVGPGDQVVVLVTPTSRHALIPQPLLKLSSQDWETRHLFLNQIDYATAGGPLINLCTTFISTL